MDYDWLPHTLIGGGILLGGIMLAETVVISFLSIPFTIPALANLISSLPFVVLLVGGGYWLAQDNLGTDRYPRIAAWVLAGFGFFVAFFSIIAIFTQDGLLARIGIVRWAAAAGAGVGILVGILEARAIERTLTAERTQIRNEELRRQNDRLEEFATILSHDLRNPLNVANGYMEIVQAEYDADEFARIASALDRMEQIVEETLILAQSGQVIDDPETVALSDLVHRCWQTVATQDAKLQNESTTMIVADPDRLSHLFENLFRNAVEHGGSDVTIRVGTLPDGFYVEDDGPGIPEEEPDTIFESGYSTTSDGTGFGLAIVEQIVTAHGWELSVIEGSDGGARFEITGVDTASSREIDPATTPTSTPD